MNFVVHKYERIERPRACMLPSFNNSGEREKIANTKLTRAQDDQ